MDVTLINNITNTSIIFDNKNYVINQIITDDTNVAHSTKKTIKQIGENIINSSVSSRKISIIGYLIGTSNLDLINKKNLLLNLINPLQSITIQANNSYQITAKPTATVQWGTTPETNNECFVKFNINFLAPSTLWEDINPTVVNFTPYLKKWVFPFHLTKNQFVFGVKTQDLYTTIYNNANVDLGATFTLTALAEVVNPSIINIITGEQMNLDVTLQPNDTLIITSNYNNKSITLNGNKAIKIFKFLNSKWLMIHQGENTFTYSTENNAENSLNIEIEYFNAYWGVV